VAIIISLLLVPGTIDKRVPQLADVLHNSKLRWTLGLGATLGIAVMAIALLPALAQAKLRFRFKPSFGHPAVKSLRSLSGWALGYVVANQIAIVVIRNLLRGGSGNEDAYTKAYTWFVLPHGLLAVSIATTFLPELASAIKRNDRGAVLDRSSLGIRLIALVTVPAGFGLFVLRRAIVGAAFQHGKFTAANSLNTSRALAGFALGLVGFSVYLFVLRVFYAHQDARTPFVINLGENLLNIVLALLFVDRWGLLGLGLAFGLAYLISAAWALQILHYKLPEFPARTVIDSLWRIGLSALVMSEVVWAVAGSIGANSGSGAIVRVVVSTIVGTVAYAAMLMVLQSPELNEARTRLRPTRTDVSAD
jgi:putative peptidoglycan lipid II flippase